MAAGTRAILMPAAANPFFRWVGGKRQFAGKIVDLLPATFGTYHEPFLGGGALFLRLASAGGLTGRPQLSDANPELVNAFRCVRDCPGAVIELLRHHEGQHNREWFLSVRNMDRDPTFTALSPAERAARFIYLTNAAYNGGWRVARSGFMTSSPATESHPRVLDAGAILQASWFLRDTDIGCTDFRQALGGDRVAENDLVFLDPPHLPDGAVQDRARYTARRYSVSDQQELDGLAHRLAARGAHVVMSVAWHDDLSARFPGFNLEKIERLRTSDEAIISSLAYAKLTP